MEDIYILQIGEADGLHLSAGGRMQALAAGRALVGHAIASLCYSSFGGAKETALIVAGVCHCSLHPLDDFEVALARPAPLLFVLAQAEMMNMRKKAGLESIDFPEATLSHVYKQLGKWTVEVLLA